MTRPWTPLARVGPEGECGLADAEAHNLPRSPVRLSPREWPRALSTCGSWDCAQPPAAGLSGSEDSHAWEWPSLPGWRGECRHGAISYYSAGCLAPPTVGSSLNPLHANGMGVLCPPQVGKPRSREKTHLARGHRNKGTKLRMGPQHYRLVTENRHSNLRLNTASTEERDSHQLEKGGVWKRNFLD